MRSFHLRPSVTPRTHLAAVLLLAMMACVSPAFATDVGHWPSLRLDQYGTPHIACYDAERLGVLYATKQASDWVSTFIDGSPVLAGAVAGDCGVDIALSAGDRLFAYDLKVLQYRNCDPPVYYTGRVAQLARVDPNGVLHYTTIDSTGVPWRCTTFPQLAGSIAMGTTPSGQVHAAYADADPATIRYAFAEYVSAPFASEVAAGTGLSGVALAFDLAGTPRILYRNAHGVVMQAKTAQGWTSLPIALPAYPDSYPANDFALAFDGAGLAHIALNVNQREVWYVCETAPMVLGTAVLIDSQPSTYFTGGVGIAVESSGIAHVGYVVLAADLQEFVKHAFGKPGDWTLECVDTTSRAFNSGGERVAVALNNENHPSFAYHGMVVAGGEGLWYAARGTDGWTVEQAWPPPTPPPPPPPPGGGGGGGDPFHDLAGAAPQAGDLGRENQEAVLISRVLDYRDRVDIVLSVQRAAVVTVEVFDVRGRLLSTRESQVQSAGEHRLQFEARGLLRGLYIVRARIPGAPQATAKWLHLN